jgi:CheY-like chemotaxis protein
MSSLASKKILVVDDEPMLREILRDVLEFEGAEVQEADNGRNAFDLYQKSGFHAVISDIRMPGGDGLELLRSLRALDCEVPVVMLITGFSELSHDSAYNLGADAVISKPFDVNELLARLGFLLSSLETRLSVPPEGGSGPGARVDSGFSPAIGRGGMFVPGFVSALVGESVSFSVQSNEIEGTLTGVGIVRWIRRAPKGSLREGSGIEFRYLEAASLRKVLEWNKIARKQAFIPDRTAT